ncbi:MAG: hypothetical protein HZA00_11155 [Nitrospinae bacterium]|nr:hypothetical protein [Nitrospinota bacterium]
MFKKILIAVLAVAVSVSVSVEARAYEVSAHDGLMSVASTSTPEHRFSVFATATTFSKSDSVDRYETAYRPGFEVESDSLSYKNFSLVPGFYYAAVGIDKDKREYTINPTVAGSVRYNLFNFLSLGIGYGTNGNDKSGVLYSGKFEIYKFNEGTKVEAGVLFSNIGESTYNILTGVSFPL